MPELLSILRQAGFRGEGLRSAWAIAMRESGGNPRAFNPNVNTGDQSYGLFQINMLGPLGPARRQQFGLSSNEDLFDPATNASVAYRMSKGGTDWGAWAIGPNAYAGAPKDAYAKYTAWYDKFPEQKAHASALDQQAAAAFESGPAGVVAGPNPAQLLATKQQQVMLLLGQAGRIVAGGGFDPNAFQLAAQLRSSLAQAAAQYNAAEAQAAQYGGTTQAGAAPVFDTGSETKNTILKVAHAQVGKPYVWGGETPSEGGFDCSGLVDYAFKQAGVKIPGRLTTWTARNMGVSVQGKPYEPGDWIITNGGKHMVMYVGNGQVIAAPRRGEVVQYQPISRFDGDIVDVRRVLK